MAMNGNIEFGLFAYKANIADNIVIIHPFIIKEFEFILFMIF